MIRIATCLSGQKLTRKWKIEPTWTTKRLMKHGRWESWGASRGTAMRQGKGRKSWRRSKEGGRWLMRRDRLRTCSWVVMPPIERNSLHTSLCNDTITKELSSGMNKLKTIHFFNVTTICPSVKTRWTSQCCLLYYRNAEASLAWRGRVNGHIWQMKTPQTLILVIESQTPLLSRIS